MFLSCRPYVAITALSTGLVGVEATTLTVILRISVIQIGLIKNVVWLTQCKKIYTSIKHKTCNNLIKITVKNNKFNYKYQSPCY